MRNARACFLVGAISLAISLSTAQTATSVRRSKSVSKPAPVEKPAMEALNVYIQQEGFVDANGLMIYYQTLGKGDPLVILRGGPVASQDYFLPHLLALSRHHVRLCVDLRCTG